MPKPVGTQAARSASPTGRSLKRIVREGDDFPLVFVDPSHALLKRYFVLPITVGKVDRQPVRSTLSKRLAVREFKQGSSVIVRLRVDQLRYGISAPTMVQLVWKMESRFVEQELTQRQTQGYDLPGAVNPAVLKEGGRAFPLTFADQFGIGIVRQPGRQRPGGVCRQPEKRMARVPGRTHYPVNLLIEAVRRTLDRVDRGIDDRHVGFLKQLFGTGRGLPFQEIQAVDQVAALGRRCPWARRNDHRHINRRQGSQCRVVIGYPIAGCLCERDSLSGFRATLEAARYRACASRGVTLANRLVLKDRLPVEFGKTDCQRNQFVAEVKRAVALFPLLLIVKQFRQLLRTPARMAAAVPWP